MASEHRDSEVNKLRQKHEKRFAALEDKIKRAEEKVEIQTEQYQQSPHLFNDNPRNHTRWCLDGTPLDP